MDRKHFNLVNILFLIDQDCYAVVKKTREILSSSTSTESIKPENKYGSYYRSHVLVTKLINIWCILDIILIMLLSDDFYAYILVFKHFIQQF